MDTVGMESYKSGDSRRSNREIIHRTSVPRPSIHYTGSPASLEDDTELNNGYETFVEMSDAQTNETSLLLAGAKSIYGNYASNEMDDGTAEPAVIGTKERRQRQPYKSHRKALSFAETVNQLTLTWSGISVYAPIKASGMCGRTYKTGEVRQILSEVSGIARPGALLAVMGASGAGKSVLLSVLSQRGLGDVTIDGEVKINGQPIDRSIKALSAYIQQEDIFIGTLKVKEHLWFQAQLRMDPHIPMRERVIRIEEVMKEVGLLKCADTNIGIPGTVKGISGGEMKRLSFASEVLTNPPLLLCDEPTSGLDSYMAENVINTLKVMANKGKTIIVTIHQPSSEVFNLFDDLLLMAEGRVAYMGEAKKALDFFRNSGYPCPNNYNPADHYMHCLAIQPGQEVQGQDKVRDFTERYKDTEEYRNLCMGIRELDDNRDMDLWQKTQEHNKNSSPYKASWSRQIRALLWRCWLSQARDFNVFAIRIMQTFLLAMIIGLVFLGQELNEKGIININGALFLLITNMTFSNAFTVFNSFPLELPIFHREHNNGMYRVDAYFISKNITELFIFLLLPTIFVMILYFMVGLREGWMEFFICWITTTLVCLCAVSYGYFLSTLFGRVDLCLSISPPLLQAAMYFAGYLLNLSTIPPWLSWLQYLSWFRYSYEILLVNQWHNYHNLTCSETPLNMSTSGVPCFHEGDDVLKYYGFENFNFYIDFGGLICLIVLCRILSYICLWMRAKD